MRTELPGLAVSCWADWTSPSGGQGWVLAAVKMIDELDRPIAEIDLALRALGADHPHIPKLMTKSSLARAVCRVS